MKKLTQKQFDYLTVLVLQVTHSRGKQKAQEELDQVFKEFKFSEDEVQFLKSLIETGDQNVQKTLSSIRTDTP